MTYIPLMQSITVLVLRTRVKIEKMVTTSFRKLQEASGVGLISYIESGCCAVVDAKRRTQGVVI